MKTKDLLIIFAGICVLIIIFFSAYGYGLYSAHKNCIHDKFELTLYKQLVKEADECIMKIAELNNHSHRDYFLMCMDHTKTNRYYFRGD